MVARNPAKEYVERSGVKRDRVRESVVRLLRAARSYVDAAERLLELEAAGEVEPCATKRRPKRHPSCEAGESEATAMRGPGRSSWPGSPPLTADQQKAIAAIAAAVERNRRRSMNVLFAEGGDLPRGAV